MNRYVHDIIFAIPIFTLVALLAFVNYCSPRSTDWLKDTPEIVSPKSIKHITPVMQEDLIFEICQRYVDYEYAKCAQLVEVMMSKGIMLESQRE